MNKFMTLRAFARLANAEDNFTLLPKSILQFLSPALLLVFGTLDHVTPTILPRVRQFDLAQAIISRFCIKIIIS
jgi:hypothetical protein